MGFDCSVCRIVRDALFLDVPYIVDSFVRHADYRLHRLHLPKGESEPVLRPYWRLPAFWLFALVLLFTAYGPTASALCGVIGAEGMRLARAGLGLLGLLLALLQLGLSLRYFHGRINRRFEKRELTHGARWRVVHAVLALVLLGWALPLALFSYALLGAEPAAACQRQALHWPALWQLLLVLLALPWVAWRSTVAASLGSRIGWQAAAIIGAGLLLWAGTDAVADTEAANGPYLHVFAVLACGFAALAWLSTGLIRIPFASVSTKELAALRAAFAGAELFVDDRHDPELSARRILGGLVIGLLEKPLQFMLLPSFAILLAGEGFVWHACVAGLLASGLLIIATTLTSRWDRLSEYLRRYFLLGAPFFVSVAVMVIASLRLGGVQYVTTVLNVAPFGVLFVWIVMAYALGWWFEYQVNSVLAAKLLCMLGAPSGMDSGLLGCDVPYDQRAPRVDATGRYLSGHAMGDFLVFGQRLERGAKQKTPAFHAYPYLRLFDILLARSAPDVAHEIGRRVQLYFALINLLLILGCAAFFSYHGHGDALNTVRPLLSARGPAVPSTAASAPDHADLAALLAQDPARPMPSALVVAASGGGTRAAVYTATLLRGLHALEADDRIVLLSGVSGGGVASAYFYAHRDALLHERPVDCGGAASRDPWDCFRARMSEPFISDVLQGASEWRLQSDAPLGVLLAESFERRLFAAEPGASGPARLGMDQGVGLILNTTISGHPLEDVPALQQGLQRRLGLGQAGCQNLARPVSALAGGRLAFSNLAALGSFQKTDPELPALQLPFVVVNDAEVGLARAAALNANFPPVFPNARVDLSGYAGVGCDLRSYYVTDGGATENLGLLSALLALDSAVSTMPGRPLRDIDIVLAEASAFEFDYAQDRGIGALTDGARERLTGRLTLELLERLRQRVAPARIRIHDLALPRLFRSRGGFGTHWMFPDSIRVRQPLALPLPSDWRQLLAQFARSERYWVTLDQAQLFALWGALYSRDEAFCEHRWAPDPGADLSTVAGWICGRAADGQPAADADAQLARWAALRRQLLEGRAQAQP